MQKTLQMKLYWQQKLINCIDTFWPMRTKGDQIANMTQ